MLSMFFKVPQNWYQALQVCCDILMSNGTPGQLVEEQVIPLYYSNTDLLWSSGFVSPRFGQGAFKVSLEALYHQLTNKYPKYTQFGKPTKITYQYAEKILNNQIKSLGYHHISKFYAFGDNPEADIKGAHGYGWDSYLVKTGVFKGKDHPLATYVVHDVEEAVNRILDGHKI